MLKDQFQPIIREIIELVAARRGEFWEYMRQPQPQEVKRAIHSHPKLTLLGSGTFSAVCSHTVFPDVVLKVSWNQNDSWLLFADEVMHLNSPHLPKIHFIQKFDCTMYFSVLEKLDPICKESYYNGSWHQEDLVSPALAEAVNPVISDYWEVATHSGSALSLARHLRSVYGWDRDMLRKHLPFIQTTIRITESLVNEHGCDEDLHEGNFMLRGDTLVVTDPVY